MLTLDTTALALIAAGHRGAAWLSEFDFAGGTIYFTTWPYPVVVSGNTYVAAGELVQVQNLEESADTSTEQLTFSLSAVGAAMFAAAIGDPVTYRGRQARLYLQLFDDTLQPAGARVQRWQGYMSKVQITRSAAGQDGDGSSGKINLVCTRAGMARVRNYDGLRMNDQQQEILFPGDTGLRYIVSLLQNPATWLSIAFQSQ